MKKHLLYQPWMLVLVLISLFHGCKEKEDIHPLVQTMELTALSPNSVILRGNIVNVGKFPVQEYGFVYGFTHSIGDSPYTKKVVIGNNPPAGNFMAEVHDLESSYYDRALFVRAYLTNSKGTAYGEIKNVVLPSPQVESIQPMTAKAGDKVTITGKFLTSDPSQVEVSFNSIKGRVLEVTSSKVVVEVPEGINSYYYYDNQINVTLHMGGQVFHVTSAFRLKATFKDFQPKSGPLNSTITISGSNIPSGYHHSTKVYLGQREIPVYGNYSTHIEVIVPEDISEENFSIKVVSDGETTVLPGTFTVVHPTITSITPITGLAGSQFEIQGTNLPSYGYYGNNSIVKLGDHAATAEYGSSTYIKVTVPMHTPTGEYTVSLKSGMHTVQAPQKFTVIPPSISSFSPSAGVTGVEVIIKGTFLEQSPYTVLFGTVESYGYTENKNTLRVHVPSGLEPEKVKLTLIHGDNRVESKDEFEVITPTITSFSPTSGVAGTVVTINGTGFNPNAWHTSVKFGSVNAEVRSITATTIKAVVPSNLNPGAMKITVINNNNTIVSEDNFTVTQ